MHVIHAPTPVEGAEMSIVDRGDYAHLIIVGAGGVSLEDWDAVITFCYRAGWAPVDDDPELYYGPADIEVYVLEPITQTEIDREEDIDGEDRAAVSLGS